MKTRERKRTKAITQQYQFNCININHKLKSGCCGPPQYSSKSGICL